MDVVSTCPLPVSSIVWRTGDGSFAMTVVCKATFALAMLESPLAPEQDPVQEVDDFWDDDEARSLHAASDLAPLKLRADVIVLGHAHAPSGQPATSIVARVVVGDIDKSIAVHG